MRITLEPTEAVTFLGGKLPMRLWTGKTNSGVDVGAWVLCVLFPEGTPGAVFETLNPYPLTDDEAVASAQKNQTVSIDELDDANPDRVRL